MAPDNRPGSREKRILDGQTNVKKRGSGLDNKPSGGGSSPIRPSGSSGPNPGGGMMRGGGGMSLGKIILAIIVIIIIAKFMFGDSDADSDYYDDTQVSDTGSQSSLSQDLGGSNAQSADMSDIFGSLIGGYSTTPGDYSSYTEEAAPQMQLDTSVDPSARQKFTSIVGQGADMVTVMVYLCGTDLESRSGMGTADLQEMASATISDNVRVIVYTGGCKKWKNNLVSSRVNQIYQIKGGGAKLLEDNMGQASMSDPATLTTFIKYCNENFPANRNELILWDHGSGSLSGYAYDEKYPQSGSMSLSGIKKAIADSGVKFDFVGFDACLMATVETALMLSDYSDYMIASEETEPGVG